MKTKYAFHLGRVFTLSLAELFAIFENMGVSFRLLDFYREVVVIETDEPIDTQNLQKQTGGVVKIIELLDGFGRKKIASASFVLKDYFHTSTLKEKFLPHSFSGKLQIGVSLYLLAKQVPIFGENKRIGLGIKRNLTTAGYSVRIVFPQNNAIALPSVIVTNEHLLTKGAEIDILIGQDRIYVGKTMTVQDFEDYGRRDYQRPARDQQVGMLPPKVAQIMINLAEIPNQAKTNFKAAILDPFVGNGTIIQEAMIMGYRGVGSDISEKAVANAEKNLEWIKNRYKLPKNKYEIIQSAVKDLPTNLPSYQYLAVVTEGTLGPAYTKLPSQEEILANFKNLEAVYLQAFQVFKHILTPEKRIVIALPAFRRQNGYTFFPIIDKIQELGYYIVNPLPEVLCERFDFLEVTDRKSIIYDRKDQFVSREIFIFKLKNEKT